jgi:hypothetical protein
MRKHEPAAPLSRWLPNEQGQLVEYEIVEPTSGTAWEGRTGRRPRARLKGETERRPVRPGGSDNSISLSRYTASSWPSP